jgi:murein DD-endopeptidase MepM/ murein hydrolase activator NlpD
MSKNNTIIGVPPVRPRPRKVRVPVKAALLVLGLMLSVMMFSLHATIGDVSARIQGNEVAHGEIGHDSLWVQNRDSDRGPADLAAQLAGFEDPAGRIAFIAGLDFVAGEKTASRIAPDVDDLRRVSRITASMLRLNGEPGEIETHLDELARRISLTPSIAPARGLLTSRYGYREDPLTGERALHRGIDIGSRPDRPVIAAASGVVTRSGRDGHLGTAVTLSHGFGMVTRYGHLSRTTVEPGERVHQGDVIGFVGRSGRATGYHLHYEVRLDGRPVDPLRYVSHDLSGP